jgi:ELWxxDGT repeat protein
MPQNRRAEETVDYRIEFLEARLHLDGSPSVVRDLNPVSTFNMTGVFVGNDIYTNFDDGVHGKELWRFSRTTGAGTLVRDLTPGGLSSSISGMTRVGTFLYFFFTNRLWRTDGTDAGTAQVSSDTFSDAVIADAGGTAYIWSRTSASSYRLYRIAGAESDATLIREFLPDPFGSILQVDRLAIGPEGDIYFSAPGDGLGYELWRSNGTTAGTRRVRDAGLPAASGQRPFVLRYANDLLFYNFDSDNSGGMEVWRSDGTESGTFALTGDLLVTGQSSVEPFVAFNGAVWFFASDGNAIGLYQTDGTAQGTALRFSGLYDMQDLTATSQSLFFYGTTAYGQSYNIWRSDGTASGAYPIDASLQLASPSGTPSIVRLNDQILFGRAAWDYALEEIHWELWKTDGTMPGTTLVRAMLPPASYSVGRPMFGAKSPADDEVVFASGDANTGWELWRTNGTLEGTLAVTDTPLSNSADIKEITLFNDELCFTGTDGAGNELWKTDGAGGPFTRLTPPPGDFRWVETKPKNLRVVGDDLYFSAATRGYEPCRTDGTWAGTKLIKDINPSGASDPMYFTDLNGLVYFAATEPTGGRELWRTDGTDAGTQRVMDINPGTASSSPSSFFAWNGALYFAANDGVNGNELWRSDGVNTAMLKDCTPGAGSSTIRILTAMNGWLYFTVGDTLWRTDGTTTISLGGQGPKDAYAIRDGELYYCAYNSFYRTSNGAVSLLRGFSSTDTSSISVVHGKILFSAAESATGTELWVSDGTTGGTALLKDISSGNASSTPRMFAVWNNTLYFVATSGSTTNFWKSDATLEGTVLVAVADPSPSATAGSYVVHQGVLFYRGTDSLKGAELCKLPLDSSAPVVVHSEFDVDGDLPGIGIAFDEPVKTSLDVGDLVVQNLTTSQPAAVVSWSWDRAANRARFVLGASLADGNYLATIAAGSVSDLAGNSLATDQTVDFFFLNADATRDRKVDTQDFNLLAANFGLTGGTFSQGDFNFDNSMDSLDLNILVAQFGKRLAAPSIASAAQWSALFSSIWAGSRAAETLNEDDYL